MKERRFNVTGWPRKGLDLHSYSDARHLVEWLNKEEPVERFKIEDTGWAVPVEYKMPSDRALYMKDLRALKKDQKHAERAIEILKEINRVARKEESPAQSSRLRQLSVELARLVRPLDQIRWWLGVEKGLWFLDQMWRAESGYGLFLVARLSRYGLDWVRRCWCGKWFLAYSSRNRFHSPTCQKAFWAEQLKTPEGRERRAKYMKKHRAVKKERESKRRGKP